MLAKCKVQAFAQQKHRVALFLSIGRAGRLMRRWTYRQSDDREFTVEGTDSLFTGCSIPFCWNMQHEKHQGRYVCSFIIVPARYWQRRTAGMCTRLWQFSTHGCSSTFSTLYIKRQSCTPIWGNVTGDCQNETLHAGTRKLLIPRH
jgi:hypothetical protein